MKAFVRQHPHWVIALATIILAAIYWGFIATDRYVSKATVVLESPQPASPELNVASLLSGAGANSQDLLLLREFLRSVDMLKQVEQTLPFRAHYANHGDWLSRLWDEKAPIEDLHRYYLSKVHIEMDEYSHVLNIEVEGFTPEFAHQLTQLLLKAGESHMNEMGRRLAEEQVSFLEQQVDRLRQHFEHARQELLDFQNAKGLVSPTQTVTSISQVVATLEGELARLRAQRNALSSFQSARSNEMLRLSSEIKAMQEQIKQERDRLAQATGNALNSVAAQYQSLELQAEFAQKVYSSALGALENTRLEAARKLKQVSVLQSPLLPEYPTQPERLYNLAVFTIVTLFIAFIVSMLLMIIRDHRD